MRESLMYGSVRGARGNSRPYRDMPVAALHGSGIGSSPQRLKQSRGQENARVGTLLRDDVAFQAHVSAPGMLTWNVVPTPTVLSAQMCPLWASMIPLQIVSPSPAPARAPRSVRQKRSKI